MVCLMPVVNLPDELITQLESSESETIDGTSGPGVAAYLASDGNVRADIYIGLELDAFAVYKNISAVAPNIKMQFSLEPIIICESDVLTFKPDSDTAIVVQVLV